MVQASKDMVEDSAPPTDSHSTPIITQPSSTKPQKKKSIRKQKKDSGPTEPIPDEATNEEHISTPSYDPPQSGEDRMQLNELMDLCAKLSDRVLVLENTNTSQAVEIATLKERVHKLEKKKSLGEEVVAEKEVSIGDPITAANVEVTTASAPTTTIDELTLARTLIEIKAAKPKAVTTATTKTTTTRPKARGVVVQEPSEFKITTSLS
ncbi:hypothetical protein Tco_0465747 [Tanacetum coccineum]